MISQLKAKLPAIKARIDAAKPALAAKVMGRIRAKDAAEPTLLSKMKSRSMSDVSQRAASALVKSRYPKGRAGGMY